MDQGEYLQNQIESLVPTPTPDPVRRLAVFGNGLDLALGIPSKFSDFRDFFNTLAAGDTETSDSSYTHVYEHINTIAAHDWSNFEDALGDVFLPSHVSDFDYVDQGDLSEMDALSEEGMEYNNTFRETLTEAFETWIREEVSRARPSSPSRSIEAITKRCDAALTFNYTETLEDHLSVEPDTVLHIHGTADGPASPYFGCPQGAVASDQGGHNPVNESVRLQAHADLLESLTKEPRVDLLQSFLEHASNLEEVHCFGFSYGEADRPYIQAIAEHCTSGTKWFQYCRTRTNEEPDGTAIAEVCRDELALAGFLGSAHFKRA